jgi:hypothetical protein
MFSNSTAPDKEEYQRNSAVSPYLIPSADHTDEVFGTDSPSKLVRCCQIYCAQNLSGVGALPAEWREDIRVVMKSATDGAGGLSSE